MACDEPDCDGWHNCWECGGEGYHDLYDEDPIYYALGETEPCQLCRGEGGWVCPDEKLATGERRD